jgi:hypothetical protein
MPTQLPPHRRASAVSKHQFNNLFLMKTKTIIASCFIIAASHASHGAIASAFTGFNLAFVDFNNIPISNGTGFIAAGYFEELSDELIPSSDITTIDTAFQQFTPTSGVFGLSGFDGFVDFATGGERVNSASPFFNKTLYFVFGNGSSLLASSELAVFKTQLLFPDDSAAPLDASLAIEFGGSNPSAGTFILGTTGGTVEILETNISSVVLFQVVPEPSTLLLSALGTLALLRRKR